LKDPVGERRALSHAGFFSALSLFFQCKPTSCREFYVRL
jgi:hypothetical protein